MEIKVVVFLTSNSQFRLYCKSDKITRNQRWSYLL